MIARRACGLLARIGLQYSMRALARSTPRSGPRPWPGPPRVIGPTRKRC